MTDKNIPTHFRAVDKRLDIVQRRLLRLYVHAFINIKRFSYIEVRSSTTPAILETINVTESNWTTATSVPNIWKS